MRAMEPTVEQRKHSRYIGSFYRSVSVSADGVRLGEGVVLNISLGGCRVMSGIHIPFGIPIGLHLWLDQHPPIYVPRAVVRWEADCVFGLKFNELPELESARLTRLLWTLRPEPR